MKLSALKVEHLIIVFLIVYIGFNLTKSNETYRYQYEKDKVFDRKTGIIYEYLYKVDFVNQKVEWYKMKEINKKKGS
jgi:hypothetical protein